MGKYREPYSYTDSMNLIDRERSRYRDAFAVRFETNVRQSDSVVSLDDRLRRPVFHLLSKLRLLRIVNPLHELMITCTSSI